MHYPLTIIFKLCRCFALNSCPDFFLFLVLCVRLSWLSVTFSMRIKHPISYHIVCLSETLSSCFTVPCAMTCISQVSHRAFLSHWQAKLQFTFFSNFTELLTDLAFSCFLLCAFDPWCLHCFDTVGWAAGRASGL